MLSRLKFILDRELTVANALEKSIARYGADFEVMRFSGSLQRFGVEGRSLTLAQLKAFCDRISQALVENGLQRYDRVAIYQRGSVEYLLYSLAIMRPVRAWSGCRTSCRRRRTVSNRSTSTCTTT